MRCEVFTIRDDRPLSELIDLLVREHINSCPVVGDDEELLGIVTQQDVFFSAVTRDLAESCGREPHAGRGTCDLRVRDLMTSPAVSATEETEVLGLCRMMHRLRLHSVPIVKAGRVTGIISSLDIVRQVANGTVPV
jgi:CBS domain-containing protein